MKENEAGTDAGDTWQLEALIPFSDEIKQDADEDSQAVEQVLQGGFVGSNLGGFQDQTG